MRTKHAGALAFGTLLLLAACGSNTEQRAATGGLGGVVAGALLGGPIGAVVGGAAGGAAGTLVSKAIEHNQQTKAQAEQTQQPISDKELIANATSAAPEAVARAASIVAVDAQGQMRTLRKGTNNFTCMPDNPQSPGDDPMCLDQNGMKWAHAWMTKTKPPEGKVGFGYMLQGGSDASNEYPYATEPAAGTEWVDTGPHVMILNVGKMVQGYPSQKENPDTSQPYVMWGGTPYEHLMIPVK